MSDFPNSSQNSTDKKKSLKKKWTLKDNWKWIVGWSVFILVIILGYLIVAGVGVGAFVVDPTANVRYPAIAGNFQDAGGAVSWYVDVVLIRNILGVPAILLALLSFLGYLTLKRGFVDALIGAVKTAIGVLLLSIGSSAVVGISTPLFTAIRNSFTVNVVPLDPYLGWSSGSNFLAAFGGGGYVSWISYALIIGFVINLIIVSLKRWTNCHAVMTTGHIMFQHSAVIVPFIYVLFFRNFPLLGDNTMQSGAQAGTIVMAGIFLGTYWSTATTATIKVTNKLTDNANFAIGHQQMLGLTLANKLGKYFSFTKKGHEIVSAENRRMSRKFRIFEDNIFVQSLIIVILFLILAIILQTSGRVVTNAAGVVTQNNTFDGIIASNSLWGAAGNIGSFWVVRVIMGSLFLVAGIMAIITGVRMFVTELQQSFQGISEKVIPGAVVAVDIASVYGFSPNSVTFGFVAGVIGQFIGVGIVIGLSQIPGLSIAVTIPLFITLFFNSGAIGIYANMQGGWKAAVSIPFMYGVIEIIVVSFALGQLTNAVNDPAAVGIPLLADGSRASPILSGFNGMIDWTFFWSLPLIFSSMNVIVAYVFIPAQIIGLFLFIQFIDTGMSDTKSILQRFKEKHLPSKKQELQTIAA
ncbi:PTS ascorbate transporter subunit IIC [[Mycoplasma] testudinis]|uniref:PTS ascorbate transporter subunit IIC n=1 Tax=[Mycoplasma] testudinis TaxID=33924 RepID=UPI000698343A|nr:PTS ascorbate transporter subunit IIC [[Mycoplasma] testudinis]